MKLRSEELKRISLHSFQLTGHNNKFTGTDALLIWQYVRANQKYQRDYLKLKDALEKNQADDDYCDSLLQLFCSGWSVSEPVDFNVEKIPNEFAFHYRLVRKVEKLSRENYLFDWNHDPVQPEVILAINVRADRRLVLKEIESYLEGEKDEWEDDRLYPNNLAHLCDNFLCFYLKEVLKLTNKEVKKRYTDIFAGELQDSQLNAKIASFHDVSGKSPWCFFAANR